MFLLLAVSFHCISIGILFERPVHNGEATTQLWKLNAPLTIFGPKTVKLALRLRPSYGEKKPQ